MAKDDQQMDYKTSEEMMSAKQDVENAISHYLQCTCASFNIEQNIQVMTT